MKNNKRYAVLLLVALASACSNIESDLRKAAQAPTSVIAVQDTKEAYWAIPGSAIDQVNGNKLTLKIGEGVRYCSKGEGTADILGLAIVGGDVPTVEGNTTTFQTESTYGRLPVEAGPDNSIRTEGFGITGFSSKSENKYNLAGCAQGELLKRVEIEVKALVYSSVGK